MATDRLSSATAGANSADRLTVLYDEDCGFCKWALDRLLAWDRRGRLCSAPIQGPEAERMLAPIPRDPWLESFHVVQSAAPVVSAGAAAPPLLDRLPGGRPLAALLRAFPGTTERAYRFVADHRDWFAKALRIDATCSVRR